jgi:processive 1,2-diacylglycerol beta-glucosyltransferase
MFRGSAAPVVRATGNTGDLVPDAAGSSSRVLIISASMGAGHDGAAREMAQRLEAAGHQATVRDFLDSGPLHIGAALRGGYQFELKHVPSAYDVTYRFWYRVPWMAGPIAWLICLLTNRRVRRWLRDSDADVVVSTYPLATLCLGRMRATGRLPIPAVNFITDFGVHPLWVHRHCTEVAAARTGRPSLTCGPMVADRFVPGPDAPARRQAVRAELGLTEEDRAVLVVAGSWGVGDVIDTFRAIAADGRFVPVVVCGRDDALRRALEAEAAAGGVRTIVFGWSDRMAELMGARDALVENAGGLTSLEALRAGLPVVSFHPIAGHGKENTSAMALAGISRLAANPVELLAALGAVTEPGQARSHQIAAGTAMFVSDGARHVLDAQRAPAMRVEAWRRPVRVGTRLTLSALVVAGLAWTGLTTGVGVAAAAGAGVAHPPATAGNVAYLGIRLDGTQIEQASVARDLQQLHATAVIDAQTAAADPAAVQRLVQMGVDVEDGGRGDQRNLGQPASSVLWTRAGQDVDAAREIDSLTGESIRVFVPGRRINAWDIYDGHDAHLLVVVPDTTLVADRTDPGVPPMAARQIYLVKCEGASPSELHSLLTTLQERLAEARLTGAPLDALK